MQSISHIQTKRIAARAFGIAFLIGYLSYGIGFGLLNALYDRIGSLAELQFYRPQIITEAAILMAVFAPVNIVLAMIMMPYFKPFNQTLSYGYLGAAIASTILLIVGAVFLLLALPLCDAAITHGDNNDATARLLFSIFRTANYYCYQIAMVIWGMGGFIFAYLLYRTELVPRWLSIWGIAGYAVFVAGAFFAICGIHIDVLLDIPGGLFEIYLSVWLIVKGFRQPATT